MLNMSNIMNKQSGIFIKNLLVLLVIPFILLFIIKYVSYNSINSNKNNFIQFEQFKDLSTNPNIERFQLPENVNIEFLNTSLSQNLYKNMNLIKYFQPNEIRAKTNHAIEPQAFQDDKYHQNLIKKYYLENVSDFSKVEQDAIFKIIMKVSQKIRKVVKYKSYNWRFAKLSLDTDWNYPYTVDDVIIMPQKFVKNITHFYKTNNPTVLKSAENTLIHEWLHIIQRKNQPKFDEYYMKNWNFIPCPYLKQAMLNNKWIEQYWITNPDGVNGEWAIQTSKGLLSPLVLLDEDMHTHRKVLVKISPSRDSIIINRNKTGNIPVFFTYEEVPDFLKMVFNISQSYHPNEVFANLVADQIMEQRDSPEIDLLNSLR